MGSLISGTLVKVGLTGELPRYALDALAAVSKADPSAVMAGGVVRDTLNGKPVKDVDIFVGPGMTLEKLQEAAGPGWTWHGEFSSQTIAEYREHFGDQLVEVIIGQMRAPDVDFLSIVMAARESRPPVQVIVMKEPTSLFGVLSGMDFGFCQCGLQAGDPYIVGTTSFLWDQDRSIASLSCSRREANLERSLKRAERLHRKYPERTFYEADGRVICQGSTP